MRVSSNRIPTREAGSLKRRNNTPPMSPAPNKRVREDDSSALQPNGDQQTKTLTRGSATSQAKRNLIHTHLDQTQGKQREGEQKAVSTPSSDVGASGSELVQSNQNMVETSLPQINDGEEKQVEEIREDCHVTSPLDRLVQGSELMDFSSKQARHLVPNHSGWFDWKAIHDLERRHLPLFFNGKSRVRTPELYMEYRNLIMNKYMENPEKLLTVDDVPSIISVQIEAGRRILEFLDHWGLINCGTLITKEVEESFMRERSLSKEEVPGGITMSYSSQTMTSLSSLYCFDTPQEKLKAKPKSVMDKAISAPTLSEARLSELPSESQGPAVEYHCNSCTADCSNKRYHCQKQADFDLCPTCFNDGKFNAGMAALDFILMEAVTEGVDGNHGGWTDQETLLLLEALELFGDNWNEIAEHVATKNKAQCILHFIKMPIEDPFLKDTDAPNNSTTAAPDLSKNSGQEGEGGEGEDEVGTSKNAESTQDSPEEAMSVKANETSENEFVSAINSALSAAGLFGSDKPIALSDSGNPVMSLVAFLAALVGTDIDVAPAESTLKLLSKEDPAAHLSARHSFVLGFSEGNANTLLDMEVSKNGDKDDSAEVEENSDGSNISAKDKAKCTDTENRVPLQQLQKIRNAAATTLASVAVKAKLLAEHEEQEILHLTAKLVESQMRKVDFKLNLFKELEACFNREHEKIEKAKQRLLVERGRILAAPLNPTLPPGRQ